MDEWGACDGGADAIQSPIDIGKAKPDKRLAKLDLVTYPTTIDIFNNGHAVQQTYEGTGRHI